MGNSTPTNDAPVTVPVTDEDREAAVDLAHALGMECETFTSGAADILVQHLARHRIRNSGGGLMNDAVSALRRIAVNARLDWLGRDDRNAVLAVVASANASDKQKGQTQ